MTAVVLHVIQQLSPGGAARSALASARHSAEMAPYRHRLLSLRPANAPGLRLASQAGVEVLDAPPPGDWPQRVAEADLLQIEFWNNPNLYAFLRADLPPARRLLWVHVGGGHAPQVLPPPLLNWADHILAGGPFCLERPELAGRAGLALDSTDLEPWEEVQPSPHEGFNIGYLGTVDFVKMHPDFVDLCAGVRLPQARFIVCGPGSAYAQLQRQARQAGLAERFEWLGFVEDARPIAARLDVFGYPLCVDNYAGAELVLQEMMAAGVPPVVLDHGSAARMVAHGRTGLVAATAEEYQRAIEYLYHQPEERRRLARSARAHALSTFGARRTAEQLNAAYAALLVQPKHARAWPGVAATDGAEAFIESLASFAPQFAASRRSSAGLEAQLAAEQDIARASLLLASAASGGVLDYRSFYPHDAWLRLWAGLVLRQQGRAALATAEFKRARDLGFDHWRAAWYLAEAAAQAGARDLAAQALAEALSAAPDFGPARALQARLAQPGGS